MVEVSRVSIVLDFLARRRCPATALGQQVEDDQNEWQVDDIHISDLPTRHSLRIPQIWRISVLRLLSYLLSFSVTDTERFLPQSWRSFPSLHSFLFDDNSRDASKQYHPRMNISTGSSNHPGSKEDPLLPPLPLEADVDQSEACLVHSVRAGGLFAFLVRSSQKQL